MTVQVTPSRMRKQPLQDRSNEMVDVILEATVRILEDSEDSAFTTKQVAQVAGVSVGSLYQYFPNKQALVNELAQRKLTRLVATTHAACADAPTDARRAIAHVIERVVAEKRRDRRWWRALKVVTQLVDHPTLMRPHSAEIHASVGALIESRLNRTLNAAEKTRLGIGLDAIEGALSKMLKATPERLEDNATGETLERMFVASLGLAELGV